MTEHPEITPETDPNGYLQLADDVLQDCLDTFGIPAEFRPAVGAPYAIPSGGVFRERHEEVDPVTGTPVTSLQPMLDVRRSEIPHDDDLDDDDRIFVRGRLWEILDVQKDGETGCKILLNQVAEDPEP